MISADVRQMATIVQILAQAAHAYQAEKYQHAAVLCRQVLEADRTQADAWYLLGSACLALGQHNDAVRAYTQGTQLRPEDREFHNALALALAAQGQWSAAFESFKEVVRLDPASAEAHDNLGLAFRTLGRLDEAINCFHAALQRDPELINAQSNLGLALKEKGDLDGAFACLSRALQLDPYAPGVHNNLGIVLREQGKQAEAESRFRQALRLLPSSIEAHNNLGALLKEQGTHAEAEAIFRQVVRLRPGLPEAHNNLGLVILEQGRAKEAETCFRQAFAIDPQYADAYNNLGLALKEQHKFLEALACLEHALSFKANSPEVCNNLGMVLKDLERLDEAEARLRQAIEVLPARAEFHDNLGLVLREQARFDEAEASFRTALRHNPNYANAHSNLGMMQSDRGDVNEAEASFRHAIQLDPNLAEAHYNLGQHRLRMGDFEAGWEEHEWRLRVKKKVPSRRSYPQPLWDGSPLDGQKILLHAEQGLGDTLQFVRYSKLVRERGGTVLLECAERLHRLLGRCPEIDQLVASGGPLPRFDVHAPLMSLPRIFGTRLETIPAAVPYLSADPALVEYWRCELEPLSGLKVGIVWQGNPKYAGDRLRSIRLEQFASLVRIEGVHLISLQKGAGSEQVPAFAARYRQLTDLGSRLDETSGPFMDTAAVMMNLDLLITPDTAAAHLAGALGVPVWLALTALPEPRWLLDREDSPWYPTVRLFRQAQRGHWNPVFDRMARALASKVS